MKKEKLYKVYGKIGGKWVCLNTGGVPKSAAEFQARMQSAMRRCETKVKPA